MMDWGSVIANAVGGAASGMVSVADAQQKEDSRRELETLKGQLQMDRLQASIEAKFQNLITGIEGKLAVQDAKNNARDGSSGGGKSKGVLDLDPAGQQAAEEYFGVRRKPTDRSRFETMTKEGDPLSRMTPEEEQAAIESGGDVGDALSRKLNGMVSTAFDDKGYSKAESDRIRQNLKVNTLLTNAGAIDNLSKADAQDLINQVTEYALRNPKADVGELLDRLNLMKPGDARVSTDKNGNLFNQSTGKVLREGDSTDGATITEMIKSVDAQRKALASEASDLKAAKVAELKDALPSERKGIIQKYDAKIGEIDTKRRSLDALFERINEKVGLKTTPTAATAGNKTGTTGTTGTTKSPTLTRAERDRLIGTIKSMQ